HTARLIAVAVVVLGALGLVALAARSDRAPTLTAVPAAPSVTAGPPPVATRTPAPDGGSASPTDETPRTAPGWLIWAIAVLFVAPILLGMAFVPAMIYAPVHGLFSFRRRRPEVELPPEVDDEVEATQLAAAVEEGLRELDQGGAGEGVVASWVLLEQAAANAGTHRAAPDTPSELAGRLIDRHPVSSTPLLRLADLYREARFSRHELPESARTEARAALEQLRAELAASPIGPRRPTPAGRP
ncbi:MAG TPA: DUF4129 domain-containing protein, partial [Mycobacteriales bacterium]|nr:DUF4129 domain-containing protein [Mycobacteriales bacterium]